MGQNDGGLTVAVASIIRVAGTTFALHTGDGLAVLLRCGVLHLGVALAPDGIGGCVDNLVHGFHVDGDDGII